MIEQTLKAARTELNEEKLHADNYLVITHFSDHTTTQKFLSSLHRKMKARFDALTGIRALAVSMVFIYHNRKFWRADLHPELLRFVNEFHVGVSIFFVLSGFLLAYSYGDGPTKSPKDYGKYILGRSARVLPLYWFLLTLYYLDPKFGKLNFSVFTYSLSHGLSNKLNLTAIAQSWSLTVEFCFYLLLPFLYWIGKNNIKHLILTLISLTLLAWIVGYSWYLINGNPRQFLYPLKFILGSTFFGRWPEFILGLFLAKMLSNPTNLYAAFWNWKHKTYLGIVGIFACCYIGGLFQPDIFHHGADHPMGFVIFAFLLPVFIASFIAGLISETTVVQRFFSTRLLTLLGNASFAFYLVHISYVNIRIRWIWLGPDRNFVILWIISIFLYLLIEKPINDFVKRRFLKKSVVS